MSEQDKCIRFENGQRYKLMVLVAPHQERLFETLMEKTKIIEEVNCLECETRDKTRSPTKRDASLTTQAPRPNK